MNRTASNSNKVALVTGAAGSIGKGIVERLLGEGTRVFITDLDQAALDQFCERIDPGGERDQEKLRNKG